MSIRKGGSGSALVAESFELDLVIQVWIWYAINAIRIEMMFVNKVANMYRGEDSVNGRKTQQSVVVGLWDKARQSRDYP